MGELGIYIYIYVCVCVCVTAARSPWATSNLPCAVLSYSSVSIINYVWKSCLNKASLFFDGMAQL